MYVVVGRHFILHPEGGIGVIVVLILFVLVGVLVGIRKERQARRSK